MVDTDMSSNGIQHTDLSEVPPDTSNCSAQYFVQLQECFGEDKKWWLYYFIRWRMWIKMENFQHTVVHITFHSAQVAITRIKKVRD